jgi:hypothetical protein
MSDAAILGTQFIEVKVDPSNAKSGFVQLEVQSGKTAAQVEENFRASQMRVDAASKQSALLYGKSLKDGAGEGSKALQALDKDIGKIVAGAESFRGMAGEAFAVFARVALPAAIVLGMANIVKGSIEASAHIEHLSQEVGISVQSLSRWDYAGRTVGLTIDDISRGVGILSKQMVKGEDETGKTSKALGDLGLSAHDSNGKLKSTDDMLGEIAEKFAHMPDGADKTAAAMALLGRGGKQMIPLLNEGKAGLDELREAADAAGYTLSETAARNAHVLDVQLVQLQLSTVGATRQIVGALTPGLLALTSSMRSAADEVDAVGEAEKHFNTYGGGTVEILTSVSLLANTVMLGLKQVGIELYAMAARAVTLNNMQFHLFNKAALAQDVADLKKIRDDAEKGMEHSADVMANALMPARAKDTALDDKKRSTEAQDKLNESIQTEIAKLLLADATRKNNRREMEAWATELEQNAAAATIAAGGDAELAHQLQRLEGESRRADLAVKDHADNEREAAKATAERKRKSDELYKQYKEYAEAEQRLDAAIKAGVASDRARDESVQRSFETFMLSSQTRMTEAALSGKAKETFAIEQAHQKRLDTIQSELDAAAIAGQILYDRETHQIVKGQNLWDNATKEVVQSEKERNAELLAVDEKYANDFASILQQLVREHQGAKDQMVEYARTAADQMTSTMSGGFFDTMTGHFKDLGNVAKNFLKQLEQDIADFLAKQAVKQLLSLLMQYAANYSFGSAVSSGAGNAYGSGGSWTPTPGTMTPGSVGGNSSLPSFNGRVGATSFPSMPSPTTPSVPQSALRATSMSRPGAKDHLIISLDPALVPSVIQLGAAAGYRAVADDFDQGGQLYHVTRNMSRING